MIPLTSLHTHTPADPSVEIIKDAYEKLVNETISENINLNSFFESLDNFEIELQVKPPLTLEGHLDFISILGQIESSFDTTMRAIPYNNPLEEIISTTLKKIDNRRTKALMDDAVQKRKAILGDFSIFKNPIHYSLNRMVGVIFQIKKTKRRDGSTKEEVRGVGSGIAIPNTLTNTPLNINEVGLDTVLTCAHVLKTSSSYEKIEIYFVPNFVLHKSGLPNWTLLAEPFNEDVLIQFLKTHKYSFFLDPFCIKRISNTPQVYQEGVNPQYYEDEDIVKASIRLKTNQQFLQSSLPINASLVTEGLSDAQIDTYLYQKRATHSPYFAIGFPGMSHHPVENYVTDVPQNYRTLIEKLRPAPLIISAALSENSLTEEYPKRIQNEIAHKALTAKGMSGGPLLYINFSSELPIIEIIGVITNTNQQGIEFACYW